MSLRPASRPRPDKEKIKVQVLQKVFFDGHTQKSPNSIGMPTIRCSEPYSCAQCGKAVVDVNMDSDSSMLRTLLSDEFSAFKFRDFFFDGRRIRRFFDHHTASTSSGLQTIRCSTSSSRRKDSTRASTATWILTIRGYAKLLVLAFAHGFLARRDASFLLQSRVPRTAG